MAAIVLAASACGCASADGGARPAPAPTRTLPIAAGDYPAFGLAPDLSWIAGKLVRSSPAGECVYVVFSTTRGAPWGGRVAIYGKDDDVARFPDGDMVVVTTQPDRRPLRPCGGPGASVDSIEEH